MPNPTAAVPHAPRIRMLHRDHGNQHRQKSVLCELGTWVFFSEAGVADIEDLDTRRCHVCIEFILGERPCPGANVTITLNGTNGEVTHTRGSAG